MPLKLVHFIVVALGAFYFCHWEQRKKLSKNCLTIQFWLLILRGGKSKNANCKYLRPFFHLSLVHLQIAHILFFAIKTLTDLAPPSLITCPLQLPEFLFQMCVEHLFMVRRNNMGAGHYTHKSATEKQIGQGRRFARFLAMDSFHEFYFRVATLQKYI